MWLHTCTTVCNSYSLSSWTFMAGSPPLAGPLAATCWYPNPLPPKILSNLHRREYLQQVSSTFKCLSSTIINVSQLTTSSSSNSLHAQYCYSLWWPTLTTCSLQWSSPASPKSISSVVKSFCISAKRRFGFTIPPPRVLAWWWSLHATWNRAAESFWPVLGFVVILDHLVGDLPVVANICNTWIQIASFS